jgi:hypothetical protein
MAYNWIVTLFRYLENHMADIFTYPCIATPQGTASLADLLASPEAYTDISEGHLTRQAFLRLLLAMASVTMENQPLPGDMPLWGCPGWPGFLQVTGLPEASTRSPQAIMDLMDGSGPALVPRNFLDRRVSEADLIKALVTAYFCDRPGLKAQVKGLPISGPKPSHMGQLVAWKWGDTLADFLELNAVPVSSWVPWWKRPIDYGETLDADNPDLVQYLLWPWRRLQAFNGGIVVAAGVKCTLTDPWAIGRASLRHLSKGLGEFELAGPARVSGMILNQASPLAWKEWSVAG